MKNEERLLTADELARYLSLPRSWIYERTRKGKIPMLRIGKYCRFSLGEVLRWLRKCQGKENRVKWQTKFGKEGKGY